MKQHGRGRHHHARGSDRGPGRGRRSGPARARRGAVVDAILLLLDERPMHGYELIEQMEERSEGAWRPSPGSIYPALRRLEARGLVTGQDDDESGKRIYAITEDGHQRVADRDPEAPAPWEYFAERGPSLRPVVDEMMAQVRQISRFGSADQRQGAADILEQAKADLYRMMADTAHTDAAPTETGQAPEPEG